MNANTVWLEQLTHEFNDLLAADADAYAVKLAWAVAARAFDNGDEDRGPLTKETLSYLIQDCISDYVGGQSLDSTAVSYALDRASSIVGRHATAAGTGDFDAWPP